MGCPFYSASRSPTTTFADSPKVKWLDLSADTLNESHDYKPMERLHESRLNQFVHLSMGLSHPKIDSMITSICPILTLYRYGSCLYKANRFSNLMASATSSLCQPVKPRTWVTSCWKQETLPLPLWLVISAPSPMGLGLGIRSFHLLPSFEASYCFPTNIHMLHLTLIYQDFNAVYNLTRSKYTSPRNAREYPDVSANGFNYTVITVDKASPIGGTSLSTPNFGSIMVLINQERLAAANQSVDFTKRRSLHLLRCALRYRGLKSSMV